MKLTELFSQIGKDINNETIKLETMASQVFNPNKGQGFFEMILATIILVGFFVVILSGQQVPIALESILGFVMGYYFATKKEQYAPK